VVRGGIEIERDEVTTRAEEMVENEAEKAPKKIDLC